MANTVIDESNFIISLDEVESERLITLNARLPDGAVVAELLDEGRDWELYYTKDGSMRALAVKAALAERWLEAGLLDTHRLLPWQGVRENCYLLLVPSSKRLFRVNQFKSGQSARLAAQFLAALTRSRARLPGINLRDALYSELDGVLLPTYTQGPVFADSLLLQNILRTAQEGEVLELAAGQSRSASYAAFVAALRERGLRAPEVQPSFNPGEFPEFMSDPGSLAAVSTPLELCPQYELYDTGTAGFVLVLHRVWAEALLSAGLLNESALTSVALGREMGYAMLLDGYGAVESLTDRVFGHSRSSLYDLMVAQRSTRRLLPEAALQDALYLGEHRLLLPLTFTGGSRQNDAALLDAAVSAGPFAVGALLEEERTDLLAALG
ncbi:MAG: hypothetical protein IJ228_13845 [Succinivibrio sp.]|nr:hypothetical protein [Succinivibrio sp.]